MRFAVIARRGSNPAPGHDLIVYGSMRTEAGAHQLKRSLEAAGARAEVHPIYPSRAYRAAFPLLPKEDTTP